MREEEMAIAIVAIAFSVPVFMVISIGLIRGAVRVICHWRDVSLKIRLAERGMSAYEIEQVVRAGRDEKIGSVAKATAVPSKPPKAAHYAARA